MRIIAGTLGGRVFEAPHGHRTHPMSEKVRGALFSALGDIEGLTVLDAYTGSGALGIEAISRGAKNVAAIDIDKNAITTVVNNARALNVQDKIKAIRANITGWLGTDSQSTFDIVLADPPYDEVKPSALNAIAERCKKDGIVVFSLPPDAQAELPKHTYKKLLEKNYGDATLVFYRKIT